MSKVKERDPSSCHEKPDRCWCHFLCLGIQRAEQVLKKRNQNELWPRWVWNAYETCKWRFPEGSLKEKFWQEITTWGSSSPSLWGHLQHDYILTHMTVLKVFQKSSPVSPKPGIGMSTFFHFFSDGGVLSAPPASEYLRYELYFNSSACIWMTMGESLNFWFPRNFLSFL